MSSNKCQIYLTQVSQVDREVVEVDTKKGMPMIGKQFKQDRQQVLNALTTLSVEEITAMESQLRESGYDQLLPTSVLYIS